MSLLPYFAQGLGIDEPTAGHVISAYALGVVVGAPLLAVLGAKMARRTLLILLMACFGLFNGLSALAPTYGWMLVFRFLSGLPHGAYFGIGAYLLFALFPLYWLVKISVTPTQLLFSEGITFWPSEWTLANFGSVMTASNFPRYFLNTIALVAMILAVQLVLATLAAFAFARYEFAGKNVAFALVLVQLMIMPDILLVENYRTMAKLGLVDTLVAIGLPYFASAFAIFLLRQTFMGIPTELDEAARVEGASAMQILWRVYVPLARPVYTAFALVSVSYHWNNFLWPLIITNSVNARPLTVGLQVFSSVDQGVDWSVITAATLMTSGPLLVAFLLFQRQFVQSFMRAGIK